MADNVRQLSFEETQELCRQYRADFNQIAAEFQPLIDAKAAIAENPDSSIADYTTATWDGRELAKEAETLQNEIEDDMAPLMAQAERSQRRPEHTAPGKCTTEDLSHIKTPDVFKP